MSSVDYILIGGGRRNRRGFRCQTKVNAVGA